MNKYKTSQHDYLVHATFVTRRYAPSIGFLFLWGPEDRESFDWTTYLKGVGLGEIPVSRLRPEQARLILPSQQSGRYTKDFVYGYGLDICDAFRLLGTAVLNKQFFWNGKQTRLCPSIEAWSCVSKFALELIARQCFAPTLTTNTNELYAVWQAAIESTLDMNRLRQIASIMPYSAFCLYSPQRRNYYESHNGKQHRLTMVWHPEKLIFSFLNAAIDAFVRTVMSTSENQKMLEPYCKKLHSMGSECGSMPLSELLSVKYGLDFESMKSEASRKAKELSAEKVSHVSKESEEYSIDSLCDECEEDEEETETYEASSLSSDEHPTESDMSCSTLLTEEQLERRRYEALHRLMPMKEYVYTVPCELIMLDSWESRWYEGLISDKTYSRLDYHLEDPDLVDTIKRWTDQIRNPSNAENVDAKTGLWLETPTSEMPDCWFLRYMLVAKDDPTLVLRASEVFKNGTENLRISKHLFEKPKNQLLKDLGTAAKFFEPLKASLNEKTPDGVYLDVHEAWRFISEISPILYALDFDIRLPEQLTNQGSRHLKARFRICDPEEIETGRSNFGLTELAGFKWEAALGDEVISAEEFRKIVALNQPLIQWHGSWVLVDSVQLRDIAALIERNETQGTMSSIDAIHRALTGVADPNNPESNIEVTVEGKVADILGRLSQEEILEMTMKAPSTFVGQLRPYQERGAAWLSYQQRLGLGCCLADDMGLGKTIQLICHVLNLIEKNPTDSRGTLLICPMSVVGNWRREFNRFAPTVNVIIHHGQDRAQSLEELRSQLSTPGSVVITTYGLLNHNSEFLFEHSWGMIVLDEAQAIKNASSKRSILVRELKTNFRVALTGTPIENRLSELWSILDFLNPGLLGTQAQFQRLYGIPIERNNDKSAMERLKKLVSPFILRRVKTDPNIIQDLPDKMENKVYCTLTREQAVMYKSLVDNTMSQIENATGIARHGRVLALLTHLKQIIDHPVLYEKDTSTAVNRSGKVQRLVEMLETVISNGERALVFTQFKEMGDVLVDVLQDELNLESIPFLHGSLTSSQREVLVDEFQSGESAPVFIISLKAGGTGLNLTAATHVFHFDRWWNPAVEDQATDRAYRIGQDKTVQVHKFLTLGTLEEKIDAILEEKKNLSESIVDASGAWITQFDVDGLRELFTLSSDAMIDEAD